LRWRRRIADAPGAAAGRRRGGLRGTDDARVDHGARFSPGTPIAGRASTEDQSMFRFLGWAALIVFIIGLLVVFGVIDFIF
jgi:hypothetical protein